MKKVKEIFGWLEIGKILLITFGTAVIIEFFLYMIGAKGTNIINILIGKPLS